jgi:hypothetical protein
LLPDCKICKCYQIGRVNAVLRRLVRLDSNASRRSPIEPRSTARNITSARSLAANRRRRGRPADPRVAFRAAHEVALLIVLQRRIARAVQAGDLAKHRAAMRRRAWNHGSLVSFFCPAPKYAAYHVGTIAACRNGVRTQRNGRRRLRNAVPVRPKLPAGEPWHLHHHRRRISPPHAW